MEKAKIETAKKGIASDVAKKTMAFQVETCTSPSGLVIIAWGPSDIDGEYYFFNDKKFVNRYHNELALVGEWSMKDDKINISYSKRYFRKGIGDPIPLDGAVPGNYIDQYESYEYLSEDYHDTENYNWTDLKTVIKENSGLYELASYNLDEKTFHDVTDLQKESR